MGRPRPTHVDDAASVGRRLHDARLRAGLSQRDLAFSGCSPAYISRIEAGERVPSPQLLVELAKRLGVTAEYLATGTEAEATATSALIDAGIALSLDEVDEARRLYESVLAASGDVQARAEALEGLGKLALREGRPAEAVDFLERALASTGADPAERPGLAESLARAHAARGELAPAIAVLERCVARYDREGDRLQYVRFASLLGAALTDNGSFAEAERVVAKALEAGRDIADPYARARLYWSESRLRAEQGQSEIAERYARKTLETLEVTEDTYAIGHVFQTLAYLNLNMGRAEEAMEFLQEGWPLISASGTAGDIASYRVEEVRALAALGQRDEAAALAMEVAAQLAQAQPIDVGSAYVLLAEIFEELDERARAKELYELGIEILEQQGPSRHLVSAYRKLSGLLEREGRTDDALGVLKRAVGVQEQAGRLLV
jgi:tetratricopeptide (TPR) repeat protein